MQFNFKELITASVALVFSLGACKKADVAGSSSPSPTPTPTPVAVDPNKIKDSALLYTKDLYLWYNQIPSSFDARSYEDPEKIMIAVRPYGIESGYTTTVDRWSFAMKKTDWDNMSSGIGATLSSSTAAGDFGLGVFFFAEGDLRVKHVERESPAGIAGIRRGWRISKINGSTNITTSNSAFIVDAVYKSTSTTFTFIRPDGTSIDKTLAAAHYKEHPVVLDTIYNISSKKIGYFAFNSFLGDTTEIYSEFSRIFSKFASQNVVDVIIDLRYNGGGYVSVQEKLANYLAPLSVNGNVMMKQQYNDKNSRYNNTSYFRKLGSLNLNRVFFITTNSTASASELLINNLKPYMDVKLLGRTTHGKPVGYFPVPVGDWYVFPVSFRTVNASGTGNYFSGLSVNTTVADGLNKDWGDLSESSLASAIKFITTGSFKLQSEGAYQEQLQQVKTTNLVLDEPGFKGTIALTRLK